ncbi:ribonuclease III [Thiovibrio frasassiensis]|uniref:Ribonuclease 3 n=1 Tax=Thiovibrio frasassiensis TaxID=2984131 RepID=A0A9X4MEL2_9BACT|nr:ribonuclease III [Thiovibrio frasassiensis]MDG4474705.1 ribonuclease III [Thiovibrio frasassiensis]
MFRAALRQARKKGGKPCAGAADPLPFFGGCGMVFRCRKGQRPYRLLLAIALDIVTINSLTQTPQPDLYLLEESLGYAFRDRVHLQIAMVHSSYAFEQGRQGQKDNETLEFLGDAVLDLTVGYALFHHFPEMQEGDLTRLRSALVNERHLARMAKDLDLGRFLLLGKGEEANLGREKASILSCAFEAVAGAIFLDGGYEAAAGFVERHFIPWFDDRQQSMFLADAKSSLQELLQERFNEGPRYVLEGDEGPDHNKTFHVSVRFREEILGRGSARSKKEAEQEAAAMALKNLAKPGQGTK